MNSLSQLYKNRAFTRYATPVYASIIAEAGLVVKKFFRIDLLFDSIRKWWHLFLLLSTEARKQFC